MRTGETTNNATRPLLISVRKVRTRYGLVGDAVRIRDGRVEAVGAANDLRRPGLDEASYPGAVIVPGMRDAHFHPVAYTAAITGLTLDGASSIADVLDALRTAHQGLGKDSPLVGLRLNEEALLERRLPTADEITAVTGERPTILHRYCGHVAVANRAALERAGIDGSTPDPVGGIIDRRQDGSPSGGLRETAIDLVARAVPGGASVGRDDLAAAVSGLAALGVTSIGALLRQGEGAWASLEPDETRLVSDAAPEIPIKIRGYVIADAPDRLYTAGALLDEAGPRIRWQGLKRFGDGSFGGHTAAMHEPYSDHATVGTLRLSEIDVVLARTAVAAGKDVAFHAIGDRACTAVIDLMADLVAAGVGKSRLRIEHLSVIRRDDIARLAALGIVASVQPSFMGSETEWLAARVGAERLPLTYPFRTMWDAGITLAGGSDCPVETPDPWSGMALARDRAGIVPAEGLTPEEAFALYTAGGAAALGEPEPLAIGSPADLVVVDRDPVAATPDELRHTEVIATYVDGAAVDISRGSAPWPG